MSHDKVLSLLEAASSALNEATHIMKDYSSLPLPPSPISPSVTSLNEFEYAKDAPEYFIDEALYDEDGNPIQKPKVWCVPGSDEKGELVEGHLADVAVHTGSYGISIGCQDWTAKAVLGPLGYCRVCSIAWLSVKDISVGDILYMHNTKKVFRGVITDQPIKGPFCSIRSLENSFAACLSLVPDDQLRSEIEVVFKVDWKEYDEYDQDWHDFLQFGEKNACPLPNE